MNDQKIISNQKGQALDNNLYRILKDLRKQQAKTIGLPPSIIFMEPSLIDMANQYPITFDELAQIQGVGVSKAKKYGQEFIDVIKEYVEENDIEIEIESENLEILSKDELLKPLLEVCLTNQSEEFCKCTTETISENYSQEDLVKLRESVAGGELPGEVFQLGLMNCAIYLGQ